MVPNRAELTGLEGSVNSKPLDPGWARRLCPGLLLPLTTREDFYVYGTPALGFYGHREFAIQNYSCPVSSFIMFPPFIVLALPQDSPFGVARENDDVWTDLGRKSKRTVLAKPGLVLVNHGGAKEPRKSSPARCIHNYSKIVFNTHFPWEDHSPHGGTSQEYSFRSLDPRDLRGADMDFYLAGRAVDNAASRDSGFSTSRSIPFNGVRKRLVPSQLPEHHFLPRRPPVLGFKVRVVSGHCRHED